MADKKKFIQVESITAGITLLTACYVFFKCRHTSTSTDKKQLTGSGQEQQKSQEPAETKKNGCADNQQKIHAEEERQRLHRKKIANEKLISLIIGLLGSVIGGGYMMLIEDMEKQPVMGAGWVATLVFAVLIAVLLYLLSSIQQYGEIRQVKLTTTIVSATILVGSFLILGIAKGCSSEGCNKNHSEKVTAIDTIACVLGSCDSA